MNQIVTRILISKIFYNNGYVANHNKQKSLLTHPARVFLAEFLHMPTLLLTNKKNVEKLLLGFFYSLHYSYVQSTVHLRVVMHPI